MNEDKFICNECFHEYNREQSEEAGSAAYAESPYTSRFESGDCPKCSSADVRELV